MTEVTLAGFDIFTPIQSLTAFPGTLIGSISPGTYSYKITYLTNFGETDGSPESPSITLISQTAIELTNIAVSNQSQVTHKNVYRKEASGSDFKLLVTLENNVTAYIDIINNGNLGAVIPIHNTASSIGVCRGRVIFSEPVTLSLGVVTAEGTTLDTAANITTQIARVLVPFNLAGVLLPFIDVAQIGTVVAVYNLDTTNNLSIYPPEPTDIITGYPPGAPYILLPGGKVTFDAISIVEWRIDSGGLGGASSFTPGAWLQGNGTGPIIAVKNNMNGLIAPTTLNDINDGYVVGSRWYNTAGAEEYVCLDNSAGAAAWIETTAGASGGEANTASSAGGISLVLPKSGDDLPFRGLAATSSKISLSFDATTVGIDVDESVINIDNLLNAPTGTIVGETDTQTLTNKTLTSTTNDIAAKYLHSATTLVNVSLAAAPTTGQILTATSGTTATWQNPITGVFNKVTSSSSSSTTSPMYVIIPDMSIIPSAGTYFVTFSSSGSGTSTGADLEYSIYVAGVIIPHSARKMNINGDLITSNYVTSMHTQDIITVNGAQSINIMFKTNSGTFTVFERSMILMRLS